MHVMIDTNVILDVLSKREPFIKESSEVLMLAAKGNINASITANTVTDIYYLIKKHIKDNETAKNTLLNLFEILEVTDVTKNDCIKAFDLPINDFEDALLAQCAKRVKAEYIISRNNRDFINSPVKTITPKDFLVMLYFE